ncbi:hypothetical protein [uncultured Imperialibacter sp.]|uniref:hypothetical protein n=1 Tax=uncultured Imperialibacter sp. TaxID=1672639 RepID=UPI0030D753CC|tara:strand:+ start:4231 stop:5283 length:1053 start_codon:yes stop_codon:yes gene_type:complete
MKIDDWLTLLEEEQLEATKFDLPVGSIPSVRTYPLFQIKRSDPNVFFPALIASKLLEWKHLMNSSQTERADKIAARIVSTVPLYKSRRGRMHYNFWPTSPDIPFPNGRLLHRFDFFRLPDDIDDTALVYSALPADQDTLLTLRKDIEKHFIKYYPQQPKVYAAWLGDKMPWVVDTCAIINLLSLFRGLWPTEFTRQSDEHIKKILQEALYVTEPYGVAPYYPDTAVIAYHLARWVSEQDDTLLLSTLQKSLEELLKAEKNEFRAMLYGISLMRLGASPIKSIAADRLAADLQKYPWFYGTMLSAVKPNWLQRVGRLKVFHISHSCPAWNYTLWVEYTLLKKMIEKRNIVS